MHPLRRLWFLSCLLFQALATTNAQAANNAEAIPFAFDGHLKMFYDIRMYPAAIHHDGNVFITWRGERGLPQVISYDLDQRTFSDQVNVYEGIESAIDADAYVPDQHFVSTIWRDKEGYFHIIAGCHGLKSFEVSDCDKVKSKLPNDIASGWVPWSHHITSSINYPKIFNALNDQTLIYFRDGGHLGAWTYRLSPNGETDWSAPVQDVVDLNFNAHPDTSCLDFYAGSYHNARVSEDGKTLHIAFVWQQEIGAADVWPEALRENDCVAPVNERYRAYNVPQGRTRYNLYYVAVDLESGLTRNYSGERLTTPVTRSIADQKAKILDTNQRLFSVPPAIHFDQDGQPQFLGVISDESPNSGWFTHIRLVNNELRETRIVRTSNVWNAGLLDSPEPGVLRALLVVGDGEVKAMGTTKGTDLNRYGWGDRIEEWVSRDGGDNWIHTRNVTPQSGMRYQNIRTVSTGMGGYLKDVFIFYGWEPDAAPGQAVAFLWDDRH